MARGRMQGTQAQLRRLRDDSLRRAENDAMALLGARTMVRKLVISLNRQQWEVAFYTLTDPTRAARIAEYLPYRQTQIDRYARQVHKLEASAAEYLATARKAQYELHLQGPLSLVLQEPGWWTLVRMCWQGWRRGRVARCGNSML